jgi:selenocysteine-specific elongation factor
VDHGKSALVQAMTGIDPDRLAEEKTRGMTIDLGFAWLTLPSGQEVSIVDVPGHESFIKNMLAGVGGVDAALLVIAADEGIMPQTREHLAILDLLRVSRGVVALTKVDLVDEEWLDLVREEVAAYLQPTTLADAAIIPVSSVTGQGIPDLLAALDRVLAQEVARQNIARPRLPIDRVFTLTGFGTVVTGTLVDGAFAVGQEVEVLPQGLKTRVRGLQTHKQTIEKAVPGSRVAINLANVARADLSRGNVVGLPGQLHPTQLLDVRLQLLEDAERPLTHNMLVDFFSGAQEVAAKVRLLDTEVLQPGESAWVQLRLSKPALVARRDRFILRVPSPSTTIGGGEVADVQPRYHRRFQPALIEALEQFAHGSPEELVLAVLGRTQSVRAAKPEHAFVGFESGEVVKQSNLAEDVTQETLKTLLSEGRVRKVGSFWFAQHIWETLVNEAVRLVREHHQRYPLRAGLSKEEWRTRLHLAPRLATDVFAALRDEGHLEAVAEADARQGSSSSGSLIRLPGFAPQFTSQQQQQVERVLRLFQSSPSTPPDRSEVEALVGAEILTALIEQGQLIKLGDSILFLRETYDEALMALVTYLQQHGRITVSEARDVLGTTRKYILPLLEHMDALRITRRVGDERVLGLRATQV